MRTLLALVILAIALSLGGCANVRPWERGTLIERCMQASLDPLEAAIEGHVHATREGMSGAALAEGASCGCN